ncbi:MAG: T9SS type A sorting domain-containing protein, partial [Tannerella sp.]|nr:T9SS type A sorting domain-containing protein [Tannerella sp.]
FAVGGDWGGAQGVDANIWPQEFLIDYVRVYQKSEDTGVKELKNDLFTISSPSKDVLEITSFSPSSLKIDIYSLSGQKQVSQTVNQGSNIIHITSLPVGVYIISVSDGNEYYSHKIIK